jgi:hypothetical protein
MMFRGLRHIVYPYDISNHPYGPPFDARLTLP